MRSGFVVIVAASSGYWHDDIEVAFFQAMQNVSAFTTAYPTVGLKYAHLV
jgi:hypothetical protein